MINSILPLNFGPGCFIPGFFFVILGLLFYNFFYDVRLLVFSNLAKHHIINL